VARPDASSTIRPMSATRAAACSSDPLMTPRSSQPLDPQQ
jgi:hypothetical protein